MLEQLKFVLGSVAKNNDDPELTHFVINNGTVRGYNGIIALCSPIPLDIVCKPKAKTFIKAISNCGESAQLSLTTTGRLSVKSGKFRAFVDCIDGETHHVTPTGKKLPIDGKALLAALKTLAPIIGDDANRPWSNGVLLLGQSAYATNNVVLCEYWTGLAIPVPLNIPKATVKEVLRIGEEPIEAQIDERSVTLHYSGDRWLRSHLLPTNWPDLGRILNKPNTKQKPLDPAIFEALTTVKPFCDDAGRIIFRDGGVHTHAVDGEGASHEIEGFDAKGIYKQDVLWLLKGMATTIDWTTYPNPCIFFGDKLRGAIIGMRK